MLYFKPIRFDNESVHHGLPVLEPARGLDPWCSDQKDRGFWGREWMTGRQRTALQLSEEFHINTEHLALLGQSLHTVDAPAVRTAAKTVLS